MRQYRLTRQSADGITHAYLLPRGVPNIEIKILNRPHYSNISVVYSSLV